MSSIINFPEDTNSNDSTTKQSYSQKLMWALRNFITETGSGYYDDRIDEGILSMYYALSEVDVKIHVEVTVTEESYRCKIQMHCHLDPDHEDYENAVLLLLYDLNEINMEVEDGCFTLDSNTGFIHCRTFYEPGDTVSNVSLDRLLGYPQYLINKKCKEIVARLDSGWYYEPYE
ncbi:MAG TPA: hypothetical protein PLE79_04505 [Clostridia bacterium]|nr:hypothetical protein [Clostridia bacterium]